MTETLIVLPVMVLLALAGAEFGRILMQYTTLTKAMQNGARHLANTANLGSTNNIQLDTSSPNGNVFQAINLIVYGNIAGTGAPLISGFSPANVSVCDTSGCPTVLAGHIRIQVTYNFVPIFSPNFSMLGFGQDVALTFPLRSEVSTRAL